MPKSRGRKRLQPRAGAPETSERKILICIPAGSGEPDNSTQVACADAAREAHALGWKTVQMVRATDSMLVRARDVLFSAFYASDCSDVLFVDDDVAWNPGTFTKIMSHAFDKDGHPVELVAGVYPGRGDPLDYVVRPLQISRRPGEVQGGIERTGVYLDVQYPSGLAEVEGAATGFMRLTRAGAQRMVEAHADDWYEDPTAKGLRIYHLFDFVFRRERRQLFSEDYIFCERFRAAGGRVFVDVDLTLHHTGKKTWTGNFGEFLRAGGSKDNPIAAGAPAQVAGAETVPIGGLTLVDAVRGMIGEADVGEAVA